MTAEVDALIASVKAAKERLLAERGLAVAKVAEIDKMLGDLGERSGRTRTLGPASRMGSQRSAIREMLLSKRSTAAELVACSKGTMAYVRHCLTVMGAKSEPGPKGLRLYYLSTETESTESEAP